MKTYVICFLAMVALASASPIPGSATFDFDAVSRQSWVQDLGARGCQYANQVRAQYGRSQLYYSSSLTEIGARHSGWMAYYNILQHQNLNGKGAWVGQQWLPVTAENIAMSAPRSNDAAWDAHQQWYHSRGHFLNMINPQHTHCGVGIAYDGHDRWWGTQLFGQNRHIGNEYGGSAQIPARTPARTPARSPAPAPAPAPARTPAPTANSTPRQRPTPSGDGPSPSGTSPTDLQTSLLGEPLSIDTFETASDMPRRQN